MSQTRCTVLTGIAVTLCFLSFSALAETYSNAASIFDLGMGARPFSMGSAFVGLADDGNAILYNQAGLAWESGLSFLSSYEARPDTASYGTLAASFPRIGFSIHYFDFGVVSETDEFGNIVGTFSYSNVGLVAASAVKASDLPFLSQAPLAENFGFGLGVRLLKVNTLNPGSGTGLGLDFSVLFRSESPSPRVPIVTGYGLGAVIENVTGLPVKYESGHQEDWPLKMVLGTSLEFLDQIILAVDFTSEKSFRLGVEWTPIPAISFRSGIKNEGVWMWSFGGGLAFRNFVLDFSIVPHPYLNSQLRGAIEMHW